MTRLNIFIAGYLNVRIVETRKKRLYSINAFISQCYMFCYRSTTVTGSTGKIGKQSEVCQQRWFSRWSKVRCAIEEFIEVYLRGELKLCQKILL